jgi:hypothetical protein
VRLPTRRITVSAESKKKKASANPRVDERHAENTVNRRVCLSSHESVSSGESNAAAGVVLAALLEAIPFCRANSTENMFQPDETHTHETAV